MTEREIALKMIPVLVRWAQASWDKPHYYSDLSAAIGYGSNQIGHILGEVKDIMDEVSRENGGKTIPPLNALVQQKSTGLPADGFDYVIKNYSKLSVASKEGEVKSLNLEAHKYDWNWVLKALALEPAKIFSEEDIKKLKENTYAGYGKGEGPEHKAIKEYIVKHPESVGIRKKVVIKETEHDIPSGDRLDVYFQFRDGNRMAIEVKPSTSSDQDITRGIYQCVKYQAVMDALRSLEYGSFENSTLLVIGGKMSSSNKMLANDLGIKYMEEFKIV